MVCATSKASDQPAQIRSLIKLAGCVGQSVTCLAKDVDLTANPGVRSSILALSHTFVEIVVSYKRKYVHKVLVNSLIKLAQEKCG